MPLPFKIVKEMPLTTKTVKEMPLPVEAIQEMTLPAEEMPLHYEPQHPQTPPPQTFQTILQEMPSHSYIPFEMQSYPFQNYGFSYFSAPPDSPWQYRAFMPTCKPEDDDVALFKSLLGTVF